MSVPACRRAAPPPLSLLCLWSANNLGSIRSVYLTPQRFCHSASSVYLWAQTNQAVLWECRSSHVLHCSLKSVSPPSETLLFFLLCPTVARTCRRQEIYAALWHLEDVNKFCTRALRSHGESSGGWQSAGVFAEEVTSLFHCPQAFLSSQDLHLSRRDVMLSDLQHHFGLSWSKLGLYGGNGNILLWLPDWLSPELFQTQLSISSGKNTFYATGWLVPQTWYGHLK